MATTKYKEYFEKMLAENKEIFDSFAHLHMEYSLDQVGNQVKFNSEGAKVLEVVREYENRLCSNTERGMYNKFSGGLAEKFQAEIKSHFPLIDHIGLIIQNPSPSQQFSIKRINLK
jgi:hypothetical protein